MMVHVLIVDDHSVVSEGTKALLEQEPDLQATIIHSSLQVLKLSQQEIESYDLYLLDLNMPNMNGLELTEKIRAIKSNAKIVIYTGYDIASHFNFLIEAGVSGFISKSVSKHQFIRTIRCLLDGEAVIPLELLPQLRRIDITVKSDDLNITLTNKEEEILVRVAKGLTNREIATELYMSQRYVERNLSEIFKKVKVNSRAELIHVAKKKGLIPDLFLW
ncbi:response regulator transcription factor [Bacillus alkalicellulosilyticus]|uniref:response regulator transcription factor n=1 Tax=Alkalihalobacterium alkalicellulosilyticum TaxID=1912214 RepID=UPI001FECF465|nr:response regulator transcription factor [Bacillus alkalicellulosilyticus]